MRLKRQIAWGLGALLLVAGLGFFLFQRDQIRRQEEADGAFVTGTTFAMNTFIEQKWYGPNGQRTMEEVNTLLTALEGELSQHLDSSEIGRLNDQAGKAPVPLTPATYAFLKRARDLSLQSEGAFDITIAPLVNAWDITGFAPRVPTPEEIQALLARSGLEELVLEEENLTAYLPREGMAVDLGGIAKGWACGEIRSVALQNGITRGYVSLGGNLMVLGKKPDGSDFKFGVRDPRGPANEYIGIITLEGKTMATTGDYERYFEVDGVRYHHVFDPRTGYPANGGLISVSVLCEDGALADYLSTTLFVLGRETALAQLDDPRFDLILVDSDLNVYVSTRIRENFTPNSEKPQYQFIP